MAKTNIVFNNKNYQVEDSNFAPYSNALKSHFSSVMNGSGATINFGGTTYNIDSAKLEAATSEFVAHLRTIAGNGYKVVVGGVEYPFDAAKVQSAIAEIEAVLGGSISGGGSDSPSSSTLEGDGQEFYTLAPAALRFRSTEPLADFQEVKVNGQVVDPSNYTLEEGSTIVNLSIDYLKTLDVGAYDIEVVSANNAPRGGFTVAAPELNEYGFYYNQPYTAYVGMLGNDVAFFVREDGTFDSITGSGVTETGTYEISENSIVSTNSLGTLHSTISSDGMAINCMELGISFMLGNESIAADEDFLYRYDASLGGYNVTAIDKTKASYCAIKTGINGKPTVALADGAFEGDVFGINTSNLMSIPELPTSVTRIGMYCFRYCNNLTNAAIPYGVTTIDAHAFCHCANLASVLIPNSVTNIGALAFADCTNLTSIAFEGTVEQWNAITKYNTWNSDTPATYVQCSDGQVAL